MVSDLKLIDLDALRPDMIETKHSNSIGYRSAQVLLSKRMRGSPWTEGREID